mmetsp:Transcript_24715/g.82903  ORF Transcript_24715/g.82903 Transcript_24715/m.82903 type:complete len:145 (+) Transcript_24715:54-488(+)
MSSEGSLDAAAPDVKSWLEARSAEEVKALKERGAGRILALPCANFCTEDDSSGPVWNRIEVTSAFDFSKVEQVLLSPAREFPFKPNFDHVHVILQVAGQDVNSLCLLLPYVYDTRNRRNTLKSWCFVNSRGIVSRLRIDDFVQH